jgi:hypothetical protein
VAIDAIPPVTETERQRLNGAAIREPSPESAPVHRALWRLADNRAEVCATLEQIAAVCGLGEHAVRGELKGLVDVGTIVPAGRRGKTTVFRLTSAAETQPRRSPARGESSTERSTADRRRDPSPMEDEDRAWLDSFEWTPELRAEYAAEAQKLADRYGTRGPSRTSERRLRRVDGPEEPLRRGPDVSERYFEAVPRRVRRRPEIWLPAGVAMNGSGP